MSDLAEKLCPHCGHSNRLTAKNCSQCGTPFFLAEVEGEMRKRCAQCGHYNRMNANVCTNCGTAYAKVQIAARGHNQKWCPQCGSPRKTSAKVCPRCGFRFISKPAEPAIVQSEALADPATVIEPPDLRGEPAPYISPDELREIRLGERVHTDLMMRVLQTLLRKKP